MAPLYISGTGYHHPERRVTNDDLARQMDTSDAWIREHTGIVERRYAEEGVDTSDLGALGKMPIKAQEGVARNDISVVADKGY